MAVRAAAAVALLATGLFAGGWLTASLTADGWQRLGAIRGADAPPAAHSELSEHTLSAIRGADAPPAALSELSAQCAINDSNTSAATVARNKPPQYEPFAALKHAAGWRVFSRQDVLTCAARLGGVIFVGDSTARELWNALARLVKARGATKNAPYEAQVRLAVLDDVPMTLGELMPAEQRARKRAPSGLPWSTRVMVNTFVGWAFTTNLHPSTGERIAQMALNAEFPARTFVVNSALWDLRHAQGGFLQLYNSRMAALFRLLRRRIIPRMQRQAKELQLRVWLEDPKAPGKRGKPLPFAVPLPRPRLLWRAATPTVYERMPRYKRDSLTMERVETLRAAALRAIGSWNADVLAANKDDMPAWEYFDPAPLLPLDRLREPGAELMAGDGYHPSGNSTVRMLNAILSQLCDDWRLSDLDALADGQPEAQLQDDST